MTKAFKYYIPGAKYWPGIFHVNTNQKVLFLTFDDGPTPQITEWILALLRKYEAKATFFMVGKNVEKYPLLYQAIINEGHAVGNHTYSHVNGLKMFTSRYVAEVEKASQFIDSSLFRPPYGKLKPSQILRLRKKYKLIFWDFITRDFEAKLNVEESFSIIKDKTKRGSILVFHDSKKSEKQMKELLPKVLEYFTKQGYIFRKIEMSLFNR